MSERALDLVLCRHGESEGNMRGIFTCWLDLPLTEHGQAEARASAARIKSGELRFGTAFTSGVVRAQRSCALMLECLRRADIPTIHPSALNERDYRELAGIGKDEARAPWGAEQVRIWRRSYAWRRPAGESLRDAVARVLPCRRQNSAAFGVIINALRQ